jgi:hypothetical protein
MNNNVGYASKAAALAETLGDTAMGRTGLLDAANSGALKMYNMYLDSVEGNSGKQKRRRRK